MGMSLSLGVHELATYTAAQLNTFFPDGRTVVGADLQKPLRLTLERVERCFRHINRPEYGDGTSARFDIFHSDQYCTYLYYLSNTIYRAEGDLTLAKKLFCLNKALHAFNCLYDAALPEVFQVVHAIGTVLGKAQYANYLVVVHNCTIGAIRGVFPTMGERLIMGAGSAIIGECTIGDNVMIAPGTTVIKTNVPDNSVVASETKYAIRPNTDRPFKTYFRGAE